MAVASGCTAPAPHAEIVYFPNATDAPRVVHLKSFNSLNDLIPRKISIIDLLRGGLRVHQQVGRPAGIAYRDGHLFICDTQANVVHDWNLLNGEMNRIGQGFTTSKDVGYPSLALVEPVAVAVGSDGTVFVADTGRGEVVGFAASGVVSSVFKPVDRGDFRPVAVAVSGDLLFVADIATHQIDAFLVENGHHTGSFGGVGEDVGKLYYAMGLDVDADGSVYVSDMLNSRVQVFDRSGNPKLSFGQPGNRYGDMGKPRQLAVAPDGTVLVADSEFAHVHLFDEQGRLLILVGGPSDEPGGTPLPIGVAIAETLAEPVASLVPSDFSARYFFFVSNSFGTSRISLFAVGERR